MDMSPVCQIWKGEKRQGRQKKRWEDNIREWSALEFAKSQRTVENIEEKEKEKKEATGCEVMCGAPTKPAVKG